MAGPQPIARRRGSESRKSIILPPSQSHWHAQSAPGHRHQPPLAYFTGPAPSEGSQSPLVDESAKGSSESHREINMSRRKQAKPQHLRSDEEATRTGLLCRQGRCPGGFNALSPGLPQLPATDHRQEPASFEGFSLQRARWGAGMWQKLRNDGGFMFENTPKKVDKLCWALTQIKPETKKADLGWFYFSVSVWLLIIYFYIF